MSFTVSMTSTTASPLSTPSLKSSKYSSFMVPSRGLVWRQDYSRCTLSSRSRPDMLFTFFVLLIALGLFAGMLVLLEVGRRIGLRRMQRDPESARAGVGAADGAIFALLGLLIAFTFSGAASRFDQRRSLIIEEANAIGTAYLRVDLAAPDLQPALRDSFRRYLAARLEVYQKIPDMDAVQAALANANRLQTEIWGQAIAATRAPGSHPSAAVLFLPA